MQFGFITILAVFVVSVSTQDIDGTHIYFGGVQGFYSSASSLTWHNVGADRFVFLNQTLDWEEAGKVCRSHQLDLYEPKVDSVEVARYIDNKFGGEFLWIGARGTGLEISWVTGASVGQDAPWAQASQYGLVSVDSCMVLSTYPGDIAVRGILAMATCTGVLSLPFLCG